MRYLGGKSRLAAGIAEVIKRAAVDRYVEPFTGGGSVLEAVCKTGAFKRYEAGDLHPDLVLMWKALQLGWEPPESIPFEQWSYLKGLQPSPLRGFAGFGASFGGHWFRAYARQQAGVESDETVQASRRTCLRQGRAFRHARVRFVNVAYDRWELKAGDVVYCDPPYASTAGYCGIDEKFDHARFWSWCEEQVRAGVRVLVSEFTCPLEHWYRVEYQVRATAFSGDNQFGAHGHDLRKKAELVDALWAHEDQLGLWI